MAGQGTNTLGETLNFSSGRETARAGLLIRYD